VSHEGEKASCSFRSCFSSSRSRPRAVTARDAAGRFRNKSFYLGESESRGKSRQVDGKTLVDSQSDPVACGQAFSARVR
jgi:hypothetical protein